MPYKPLFIGDSLWIIDITISGWWLVYLPLWKIYFFVSWDDDIPNWMESHKFHGSSHHQPSCWFFPCFAWWNPNMMVRPPSCSMFKLAIIGYIFHRIPMKSKYLIYTLFPWIFHRFSYVYHQLPIQCRGDELRRRRLRGVRHRGVHMDRGAHDGLHLGPAMDGGKKWENVVKKM